MTDDDKKATEPHDDAAGLIHDLANGPPPKGLDTIKAASDAVGAEGDEGEGAARRGRIERRAYDLWEADGRHHGSHEDFWHKAEAEIAGEEH